MIVSFSGLDGAGKSTQIELLIEYFNKKGKKTKYIWARGGYTPMFNWIKKIIRKVSPASIPKPGKSVKRTQVFKSPMVRKIWLTIAIIDLAILYGVYIRWLNYLDYVVVCDRYVRDTEIDFNLNFPTESVKEWWIWKLMNKFIAKPKQNYLLIIPVEESLRRSKLKDEPFPDTPEVLTQRRKTYLALQKEYNTWHFIDAIRSIESIHKEIISLIENKTK